MGEEKFYFSLFFIIQYVMTLVVTVFPGKRKVIADCVITTTPIIAFIIHKILSILDVLSIYVNGRKFGE